MSSYLLYLADARQAHKLSHPDMDHKDVMSSLAEQWKALSDKEKLPYQEKANQLREAYQLQLKAFKEGQAEQSDKSDKPEKRKNAGESATVEKKLKVDKTPLKSVSETVTENSSSESSSDSSSESEKEESEQEEPPKKDKKKKVVETPKDKKSSKPLVPPPSSSKKQKLVSPEKKKKSAK
jgi:hypothetical protein